ncbi:MAG: helix-turn-helix domain-containing protein [Elusimicrobia bacterium]|nr:helix-turn-helix domain-containing protein [Elusimicrobiota bacterium]
MNNKKVKLYSGKKNNGGCELLDLTPKEFELLCLFLKKPNQILSRTMITEIVWQ